MRVEPVQDPPAPSTILGDWYANLIYIGKTQLILAVSEKTLLPVLIPAADAKSLSRRLPDALFDVLKQIDIPWSAIDHELREMQEAAISKTANRSVVGMMNDFAWLMEVPLDRGESLLSTARFLSDVPCSPLKMESPQRATKAAFAAAVH